MLVRVEQMGSSRDSKYMQADLQNYKNKYYTSFFFLFWQHILQIIYTKKKKEKKITIPDKQQ